MKKKIAIIMVSAVMAAVIAGCSDSRNSLSVEGQNTKEETERKNEEDTDINREKETEKSTEKQTERRTERETERRTEKETERRTERSTEKSTEKNTAGQSGSNTQDEDTFTYYGDDYSITFPKTWTDVSSTLAATIGADAVFTHYGTALNGYGENINVMVQDLSGYNMDLDTYTELSKSQYEAMDGYDIISIDEGSINGTKIRRLEVDANQNGINCYCLQVFAVENEKAYIFTFSSDYEDKDSLMEEVDLIFESIKID